jgi:hypothetical protein
MVFLLFIALLCSRRSSGSPPDIFLDVFFPLNGPPAASLRDRCCARNAPKLNVLNGLGLARQRSLGDGFSIARHDNEAKAARLR